MKNNIPKPLIFLSGLMVMGILGAIYSMALAGILWGISTVAAPKTTYTLMAGWICPSDAELQFTPSEVGAAPPGSTTYTVDCIFKDGTLQPNIAPHASKTVFTVYFLAIFIPTFVAGAIVMGLFMKR